jgi:hypothetical protein
LKKSILYREREREGSAVEMTGCGNMENDRAVFHIPTSLGKRGSRFPHSHRSTTTYIHFKTKGEKAGKTGSGHERPLVKEKETAP